MGYKDEEIINDFYIPMVVNDVSPEEQALDAYAESYEGEAEDEKYWSDPRYTYDSDRGVFVMWNPDDDDEEVADRGYNVEGC